MFFRLFNLAFNFQFIACIDFFYGFNLKITVNHMQNLIRGTQFLETYFTPNRIPARFVVLLKQILYIICMRWIHLLRKISMICKRSTCIFPDFHSAF